MTSSSPPPPKTIHDLPLETIGHIITIAHPVDWENFLQQQRQARRHFYLDTSLVCRDWTPFAQRALWKDVDVDRKLIEELVDSGGAGRYPVERLAVDSVGLDPSLETLLTSVRGLVDLKLDYCNIDASWLAGNNWRDLKSLELTSTIITSTTLSTYPFALAHLIFAYPPNDVSDQTLVALSRQVSATSLELILSEPPTVRMLHHLSPLALRLVKLELDTRFADDHVATTRGVDLFLQQCTQLEHFALANHNTPSIIHLPSPLKSWTTTWCDESCVAPILDVLKSKAIVISKLQRLCIQPIEDYTTLEAVSEAQGWEGWLEIEDVCRLKKIKLSVGRYGSDQKQGECISTSRAP